MICNSFAQVKACLLTILFLFCTNQALRSEKVSSNDLGILQLRSLLRIKNWSLDKARKYYPEQRANGERGDAYRHILASVVSRKLVGKPVASSAGWVNEMLRDVQGTNTPRDRFMDLHNNKLGRVVQYKALIHENTDSIALKVKSFIDDEANSELLPWGKEVPSRKEALAKHKSPELANRYFIYE